MSSVVHFDVIFGSGRIVAPRDNRRFRDRRTNTKPKSSPNQDDDHDVQEEHTSNKMQ